MVHPVRPVPAKKMIVQIFLYLREGDLQQNRNYGGDNNSGKDDADQCLHDSPIAVNKNRSLPGAAQHMNPVPHTSPASYSTCCKPAETSPDSPPSAVNKDPPRTIRARDYKKLEPPEPKTACYACGKKGSWYVEKLTAERRARPRDRQAARRICRSCFNEAMKAEQMASVPLPGTVDVSRCSRVTVDVGKCSVCGIAKAVWIDREAGVKLCDHCYGRGVREDAQEAGSCDGPASSLSHESTEHYTPQYILDAVIACLGAIDLDPASNSREIPNVPAARHYTAQDNGLMQPWVGRVFLNPPFGPGVEQWFSKLYLEQSVGRTTEAIVLWKSATETAAWKTLTAISCRVCFPSARIRFSCPAGDSGPGPTFSPALFYVGTQANSSRKHLPRSG